MIIRELRVRYKLKTASGREVVHGIVCDLHSVKHWVDKAKEVGYPLVGIDERFRDDGKFMELNEGWTVLKSYEPEEPKSEYGYLSFKERR